MTGRPAEGEDPRLREARRLRALWGCEPDGAPFATAASLLWPLRRTGRPVMLKIVDPEGDEVGGAAFLCALDGRGAVRLLRSEGAGLLMERAVPDAHGTLGGMALEGRDDEATARICEVVGRLHAALPSGAGLPSLIPFDRRLEALIRAAARTDLPDGARPGLERAAALAGELVADTRADWRPLHGDIHHGNVLRDGSRGWLAIDPKGIRGPRGYDYANLLCNPLEMGRGAADPRRMARQAAVVAERSGLEAGELLRWAWLHASLAAAWSLGGPGMDHWLACAGTAEGLAGG